MKRSLPRETPTPGEAMVVHRYLVSGKVQGVWFRASTREQALALGLRGYARNLPDGRVEVVVAGGHDTVAQLAAWLQAGPPLARVETIERKEEPAGSANALEDDFQVL